MHATRQALVAVVGSHEGPWQCSRGHEDGILIKGLGMGELVILERDSGPPITFGLDGQYPFPKSKRFRFIKQASLFGDNETYVEVILK